MHFQLKVERITPLHNASVQNYFRETKMGIYEKGNKTTEFVIIHHVYKRKDINKSHLIYIEVQLKSNDSIALMEM